MPDRSGIEKTLGAGLYARPQESEMGITAHRTMAAPRCPRHTTRMGIVFWDFETLDMRPTEAGSYSTIILRWEPCRCLDIRSARLGEDCVETQVS